MSMRINTECVFEDYCAHTDILMNGIYWEQNIPRLFSMETLQRPDFRIQTIADITDDKNGSVPCNLAMVLSMHRCMGLINYRCSRTAPYLPGSVDVMAVGNLPNELPRDASRYFGEQLIKYVLADLYKGGSGDCCAGYYFGGWEVDSEAFQLFGGLCERIDLSFGVTNWRLES
jgi:saccharopine dehydrogenase (NAD+, L-lysine-forming)